MLQLMNRKRFLLVKRPGSKILLMGPVKLNSETHEFLVFYLI